MRDLMPKQASFLTTLEGLGNAFKNSLAKINLGSSQYCQYYSLGIVVFLVSNAHVDSKLLTDYYLV